MGAEIPEALERYIQGLKSRDVELIATTVSQSLKFVTTSKILGRLEFLSMLRALYRGFPDWTYQNDAPRLLDGEQYAIRWAQGGVHSGEFCWPGQVSAPATHRRVQIPAHDFFYRIRKGAIVEIEPDPIPGGAPRGIFEQIGFDSPPV
jgi:hypothetical protein